MGEFCKGKKSKPVNIGLYNRIKAMVKRKVKRWPSAYASGQVVRMYIQKGGKYRCTSFGSLDRWFKERWVDVCTGKPCGRKSGEKRKYPYCRPSRRISSQTPRFKVSRSVLRKRCAIKHRIKGKRLSKFGAKEKIKKENKQKFYTLDLRSKKSVLSLRKKINRSQPGDCLNWDNCKSWTYFVSEPINNISKIKFRLVRKPFKINKTPSHAYDKYIKDPSHCGLTTIFSSTSNKDTGLAIPCRPYINLNDFAFNSSDQEWVSLWYGAVKQGSSRMKKPFYISTHGHGVNWLHIRLENNLKYKI